MSRHLGWTIGLALLLAGCAVNPVTPPAVDVNGQAGGVISASPLAVAATPAGTELSGLSTTPASILLTQPPPVPAGASATNATPTPVLIIVASVALLPAPTATRPPAVAIARANRAPTAVPPTPALATAAIAGASVSVAPPVSGDVAAAEQFMVALINAQRTARGLAPLAANPTLMSIANARVADMVARGYTGHNDPATGVALGPAQMRAAGFAGLVGENWYGTRLGPPANAEVAMKWFMTDPPHYQNILNPRYDGVGVGIAYNGQQWLLIQDFAGN